MNLSVSSKTAFALFIFLVLFMIAQGGWWVIFMAQLADEKVEMAEQLEASAELVEEIHQQEVSRQIMIGMEGTVFLLVLFAGIWLIYRTLARTEHLKRRQQDFLMLVTHELKTPVASVKLYLDSLESQKISVEKKEAIVPRMKQDLLRLEGMVDDILRATQFERDTCQFSFARINLGWLVQSTVDELEQVPAEVPVSVACDIEPGVHIRGDSAALNRAVKAVFDNARKYHSGEHIAVGVNLRSDGKKAILTVADGGIGIERRECELIFDRFYRVGRELTQASQGTGLGLYLCREILKVHGGQISASSEGPGKGAKFVISLPLDVANEDNSAG